MPLLPYFLVYLSGILAALPASQNFLFPYFLSLVTAIAGAILFARSRRNPPIKAMILVLLFPLGFSAPGWQDRLRPDHHILNHVQEGQRAVVEGWVEEMPTVYPDKVQYRVHLEQLTYKGSPPLRVTGTARITLYQSENPFRVGDRLRIHRIKLKRPRNFKNPGRFDYVHYTRSQGIDVLGGVSKAKYFERLGAVPLGTFTALRCTIRERMLSFFDRHLPEDSAALLKAMLLGEKQYLSESLRQAYIDTGLAHLMAVSGLHIGFVAGACFLILYPLVFFLLWKFRSRWALLGYGKKVVALLCIIPVLFYMLLVGAKISALRAGVMIMVYLFAVLINREKHLLNALLVAAFLILIWNPEAVVGPGFLLSFGALLTIVLAIQFMENPSGDALDQLGEVPWYRRLPKPRLSEASWGARIYDIFQSTVFITLAALLGTLPILIYFFNHISIGGIFLNLLLVPLTAVLIPLGLLTSLLALLYEPLGALLMPLTAGLLQIYVGLPKLAAPLPFMSFYVPTPPAIWPILYYALLVAIPTWIRSRRSIAEPVPDPRNARSKTIPWGLALASAILVVSFIWPRFPYFKNGELSVFLLDVGQGESIYMEFPNGETLLLDGGGYFRNSLDVGKLVVAPFLWSRGLWGLSYVGASHSDHDHISGLESLAELVSIGHFLERRPSLVDQRIDRLKSRLINRDTVPVPLQPGRPWSIGKVRLTLLHPTPEFIAASPSSNKIGNDLSMVWKIEYGAFSMLLTGDITEKAERYLVEHNAPLQAGILKAPHHGSRTSSHPEFLRAVG
ncbi:MAG: DNA internalization-related competence protein ComEC/Rec2, partial [Nitrospinota bacterium]|nr:DNA internalization-related competence protein ComEC/Rec2 [Nitrospinota bacterium]